MNKRKKTCWCLSSSFMLAGLLARVIKKWRNKNLSRFLFPKLICLQAGVCVCAGQLVFLLSELCHRCHLWLPGSIRSRVGLLWATTATQQHTGGEGSFCPGKKGDVTDSLSKGCSFLYSPAVITWTNSRRVGTMHSPGNNHKSLSALQERQPHTHNFTCT